MKTALIHDSLVEYGGSERILDALLSLYPDADVYTALADSTLLKRHYPYVPSHKLHVSWLSRIPRAKEHTSLIQAISPLVWWSFDLNSYDLVISHSHHIMSGLVRVSNGVHITYIPSPPKNLVGLIPKTPFQQALSYDSYILPLYKRALKKIPHILTNSRHTQKTLKNTLGVKSRVMYPPVRIPKRIPAKKAGKYFLIISRLDPDKNLDTAIRAATALNAPLKIAGVSNTPLFESHLRAIAGPTIEFLGFVPDNELPNLYTRAIAFVFPSRREDFGIAPIEAMAHGVPVVAFYGGGTKETVREGITGTFFRSHSIEAVTRAMIHVQHMHFSQTTLQTHAKKFSTARFINEMQTHIAHARTSQDEKSSKKRQ